MTRGLCVRRSMAIAATRRNGLRSVHTWPATVAAVQEENRLDRAWATQRAQCTPSAMWTPSPASGDRIHAPATMMEYIAAREFAGVAEPPSMRLLSSMLTYPLTASYGIRKVFKNNLDRINICVVGSRKESSLPHKWWEEMLLTCETRAISVSMVGPGLQPSRQPRLSVSKEIGGYRRDFSKKYGNEDVCTLHEHRDVRSILLHTNLFVLYNPGLGSAPLLENWKPTLQLLLQTKKPILCTSHCEHDMQRDLSAIRAVAEEESDPEQGDPLEFLLEPGENPFRSLQSSYDQTETPDAQITNCNYGIYAFQAK